MSTGVNLQFLGPLNRSTMSEGLNKGTNKDMNAHNCLNYLLASLIDFDMYTCIYIHMLLLLLLSRFSRVQLCATP